MTNVNVAKGLQIGADELALTNIKLEANFLEKLAGKNTWTVTPKTLPKPRPTARRTNSTTNPTDSRSQINNTSPAGSETTRPFFMGVNRNVLPGATTIHSRTRTLRKRTWRSM